MNKKTYLFVTALNIADSDNQNKIFNLFSEKNEEKKISGMLHLYDELGVKEVTVTKMEVLYKQALESLNKLTIGENQKASLLQLAEMIYHRKH